MKDRPSNEFLISDILQIGSINPALNAQNSDAAIEGMVSLAEGTGLLLDRQALSASLLAREAEGSTACKGCALLHPRVTGSELVSASFVVLGRSLSPVGFYASDGVDADIFFAICCRDSITYKHALHQLMSMIVRTQLLGLLRRAANSAEMFQIVRSCEQELQKL